MKNILLIYYNNGFTILVDINNNIIKYKCRLNEYINYVCLFNGSSYSGRVESFKKITKTYQKPCFIVDQSNTLFFPTRSINNDDCVLINYSLIRKIKNLYDSTSMITFVNGTEKLLKDDYRIIKKQMNRSQAFLDFIVYQNKQISFD